MRLNDEGVRDILQNYRRVAVYGMSRRRGKAAHDVPAFLSNQGYHIIPINPNARTIDGKTAYGSLRDIPEAIDILEVFRPSEQVFEVVKEAVERKKARGDIAVVWLQKGIRSEEARNLAEGAGILFVQDRCMKATFKKLLVKGTS